MFVHVFSVWFRRAPQDQAKLSDIQVSGGTLTICLVRFDTEPSVLQIFLLLHRFTGYFSRMPDLYLAPLFSYIYLRPDGPCTSLSRQIRQRGRLWMPLTVL